MGLQRLSSAVEALTLLASYISFSFKPFDKDDPTTYNTYRLPMSDTKNWEMTRRGTASTEGMQDYNYYFFLRALSQRQFNRIILVDRSTKGESVDGVKKIISSLLSRARHDGQITSDFENHVNANVPMYLINLVDWRRMGPDDPTTPPRDVTQLARVTIRDAPGAVDTLLRDAEIHPRIYPDYYPSRWDRSIDDVWRRTGGSGNARLQREALINYNSGIGGGLIDQTTEQGGGFEVHGSN